MAPEPGLFTFSWLFATAVILGSAAGCSAAASGRPPPLDRIYFPVGIALGPSMPSAGPSADAGTSASDAGAASPLVGPHRMYVANSDFDLQYNGGSLQAYDLDGLRALVPKYCTPGVAKETCDADQVCDAASHFCFLPDKCARDSDCGSDRFCDLKEAIPFCRNRATHDPEPGPCGAFTVQGPADRLLYPGLCGPFDPASPPASRFETTRRGKSLIVSSVQIGAFVTDAVYRDNPVAGGGKGRLFLPVRGDATLHWIDTNDTSTATAGESGALYCGQGPDRICDLKHRRGGDPAENLRSLQLPPEPFGVAVDDKGEAVVTTHQSDGEVALFVNQWGTNGAPDGPELQFLLPNLPVGALAIAAIPEPALVTRPGLPCVEYQPGFLMTFRNAAQVTLVRYFDDRGCTKLGVEPLRPFLEGSRSAAITTNSLGYESRGIGVDAQKRQACEAKCPEGAADEVSCLKTCAALSLDVYVSNRTPPTLILGHTLPSDSATSSDDLPSFYDVLPLPAGPSRVIVGDIIDFDSACASETPRPAPGKCFARRVFVVCFDSRVIYVYDPVTRAFDAQIYTGRGPHAFAVDRENGFGYVGHFTDSYLGVVDLNRNHIETYGKMLLSVGEPVEPRASK